MRGAAAPDLALGRVSHQPRAVRVRGSARLARYLETRARARGSLRRARGPAAPGIQSGVLRAPVQQSEGYPLRRRLRVGAVRARAAARLVSRPGRGLAPQSAAGAGAGADPGTVDVGAH